MENFKVDQLIELVHKLQIKVMRTKKEGYIDLYRELEELSDNLETLDWDLAIDFKKFDYGKIIVKSLLFCDIINI